MADYKVVDATQLDAYLTIVADAIRSKGGTTGQLAFPSGFKSAVEAIQSGDGSGSSGIDAVKCIDTDITVEASTTTLVKYTVDGLKMVSSVENPTKWNCFNKDIYIAFVTLKELTGTETGNTERIYRKSFHVLNGHTNYSNAVLNLVDYDTENGSVSQGIHGLQFMCNSITNNEIIGTLTISVRNDSSGNYEVVAGTYNIQIWYIPKSNWEGMS